MKTLSQRFWEKVAVKSPDECWLWQAVKQRQGYGMIRADHRMQYAHRVAWKLTYGLIPSGLHVCHTCDVPGCVNPKHLFLGTHADNMRDMVNKGRAYRPLQEGEKNYNCKLTVATVRAIKRSKQPAPILAAQLHTTVWSVYNIREGKAWKNVSAACGVT